MVRMEDLCIFTPTYNRSYVLPRLFESLERQTTGGFEWLIVDDGSTDDTESVVRQFQASEASFPIRYLKQSNGGKQRAHNTGVEACTCELFMCLDSDDRLAVNAVEDIRSIWKDRCDDPSIAGVVALCGPSAEKPTGTWMPESIDTITLWDLYYKKKHCGDTAHIYRTDILKQYPFYVHEDEKFMAETYVYHQIDQHFRLAVLNKVISIIEYLPDGYTKNVRQVTKDNPFGFMALKRLHLEYSDTLYLKYYNTILFLVGHRLSGSKRGIADSPYKGLAYLAYLPAWLLCKTVYR
ncbi:MAG: glycosyltransferase family 2 protein [Gordonibacter sp.]|uniref:glycosyltransferase family 2 protein n=1 Tax=Gordonibacter sp. TaxID=1968902 RepID=UPI002FCC1F32